MKKYLAPEMEMTDFIVDKSIAGIPGSFILGPEIDVEFGGW